MRTDTTHLSAFPRSFLLCLLSLWLALSAAHALDPNKRVTQYAGTGMQDRT
jgi:hypothetical protein